MIVNGNLKFHTVGLGEIQNMVVERLTTLERGALGQTAGRMIFDTDTASFYFSNGTSFEPVGDASTSESLIASLGAVVNASGGYVPHSGSTYIDGNTNITTDLLDLDAAIGAAAGADSVSTLTDTTITTLAIGHILYAASGTTWANALPGATSGVQAHDGVLDDLSALAEVPTTVKQIIRGSGVAGVYEYFTVTDSGYALLDDASPTAQRATLGLIIGTNVQAWDLNLDQIASLVPANNSFLVGSGAGTWGVENAATALGSLGLTGTAAEYNILDGVIGVDAAKISFLSDVTTNIEANIGTKQSIDATLTALAGLTTANDQMIYSTGVDTFSMTSLTSFGRALIDDTSVAAQRTTLGLGTAAVLASTDFLSGTSNDNILTGATITVESGGAITTAVGGTISMVDAPNGVNELTNKAYVDALVAGGASWKNPVIDSDLVEITATEPSTPVTTYSLVAGDNVSFIASAAFTTTGAATDITTAIGDIFNLTVQGDGTTYDYSLIESPLAAGDRFIIAAEHGTVGSVLGVLIIADAAAVANGDIIEYLGGTITAAGAWSHPDGRSGNASGGTEIEQGVTVLNADIDSVHYGHSFLYDQASNAWVEISGPGSIGAGTGLSYTGTTLNIGMGAGIVALPADEVGIDLYDVANNPLIITASGTDRVTTAAGQLNLLLDSTTLVKSATGLKVALAGITATELNTSVAGLGIAGGGGTVLSLDPSELTDTVTTATDFLMLSDATASGAPIKRLISSFFTEHNVQLITPATLTASNGVERTTNDFAVSIDGLIGGTAAIVGTDLLIFDDGAAGTNNARTFTNLLADLDIVNTLGGNGIAVQIGTDSYTARSIASSVVAGDQGISVVNGNGISGNMTVGLDIVGLTAEAGTLSSTDTIALYDGANNVKADLADVHASVIAQGIAVTDLSNITATSTTGGETLVSNGTNFVNRKIYHVYNSTMVSEVSTITPVADSADSLDGLVFYISSTGVDYYFWINTSGGAATDPAPAGKTLGGVVNITTNDGINAVATAVHNAVNAHAAFTSVDNTGSVTVTAVIEGDTLNTAAGDSGFGVVTDTQGGVPSTSHVVTHNIGQQYCNVTVVDSTDEMIIPLSVLFTSTTALTVTFNSSIDCRVVVMGINPA